ncbi:translation initiation factor [Dethiosulfovibrio salsuginis]|uniref:Translation initiation factor 1 n=1 Tax=Dethiosulfovibrio salsuginis TaxID=561720 RepID=A0A1X7JHQ5_9BACT|nr:translation initiation factor [Dethiosulfovibrio salsuginis]SMG27073.1 translation initiation factor 1 [Dethiosulfovibrio salsuginis]
MAKGKKLDLSSHEPLRDDQGPFAQAALSLGFSPTAPEREDRLAEEVKDGSKPCLSGQTVGLRIERKGRKGKTVTVVDGLKLKEDDLNRLAKELRKAIGCGSSVEGPSVVLQGDNRERIGSWLRSKGVRVNF